MMRLFLEFSENNITPACMLTKRAGKFENSPLIRNVFGGDGD